MWPPGCKGFQKTKNGRSSFGSSSSAIMPGLVDITGTHPESLGSIVQFGGLPLAGIFASLSQAMNTSMTRELVFALKKLRTVLRAQDPKPTLRQTLTLRQCQASKKKARSARSARSQITTRTTARTKVAREISSLINPRKI